MTQKSDSQGSTPHGIHRTHKAFRSRREKVQEKKRDRRLTLKGNRATKASYLVIVVIVGYCVMFRESQKASSLRPDNADRNSLGTAASINRVSEDTNCDKTMTGINLVPSDLQCSI